MEAHLLPDVLVFLNVARCGSITKAADRLNMVQSNVTARIKKLEDALGVTLLRRHARGVKLSSGGEAFAVPGLREEQIFTDKLVVLAPVKVKTRSDLFEVNRTGPKVLVQRLGCSYTERLLTFLETKKVCPERIMEMGTLEG
jgi:DNA-binding transcriptional ArsR family regulator